MALMDNGIYKVTFPSSVEHLDEVESISVKIAAELNFNESDSDDLSISITEIFNNAVHHGNQDDPTKNVIITFTHGDSFLIISIKDEGPGFQPDEIKDPLAPENLLSENGRGIYLVKNLTDDLKINVTDQGTEVLIYKKLPQ
jgi:serine/threonine-protein kinase RsbW